MAPSAKLLNTFTAGSEFCLWEDLQGPLVKVPWFRLLILQAKNFSQSETTLREATCQVSGRTEVPVIAQQGIQSSLYDSNLKGCPLTQNETK